MHDQQREAISKLEQEKLSLRGEVSEAFGKLLGHIVANQSSVAVSSAGIPRFDISGVPGSLTGVMQDDGETSDIAGSVSATSAGSPYILVQTAQTASSSH